MIYYNVDQEKTVQAAAKYIKLHDGSISFMVLIKLLYLADRESFKLYDKPITGDHACSMEHGPVLSTIYNWIKESRSTQNYWSNYIVLNGYNASLVNDPGIGDLSRAEDRIINQVYSENKEIFEKDPFHFTDNYLHSILPEWKDPGKSSLPISVEDILHALGKSEKTIKAIEEENTDRMYMERTLAL